MKHSNAQVRPVPLRNRTFRPVRPQQAVKPERRVPTAEDTDLSYLTSPTAIEDLRAEKAREIENVRALIRAYAGQLNPYGMVDRSEVRHRVADLLFRQGQGTCLLTHSEWKSLTDQAS